MCRKLTYMVSFVLVLGLAGLSNAAVIGFQAETGILGADFDPPITDVNALGRRFITIETAAAGGSPGNEDRIATYMVTFPEAGTYDLYVRLLVEEALNEEGEGGPDNDSMFYGNGFGTKPVTTAADWILCNGFEVNPRDEYIWINLSEDTGPYGETGVSFTVPEGELTQTLQVGAREDGLRLDAFVFATATQNISDAQLNEAVPQETKAVGPDPADGSLVAETDVVLSWVPGALSTESHIYFSDNFDDVNGRTPQADLGLTTEITFAVSGLVPGTVYYWVSDEVDGATVWPGDVWSFQIESQTAYNPDPLDGDINVDPNVVLSWSPGVGVVSHKVYLDMARENVDARSNCQVNGVDTNAANYSPGPLDFATTYYWAIDEVGGAPDNTTYAGEVWSFTTMPAIQISDDPNLIGWWKFDEGAGRTALDWSGHGNHGAILGNPAWVAGTGDDADAFALDFDGFGDYVDCGIPAILDVIDQITVSAWIRVDVFEQTDQAIVSKGENVWRLVRNGLTSNELRFDCGGQAIGSTNVNDGEWHHAVGTSNGTTASLYVDGALDGTAAGAGAVPTDPSLTLWIADTNRPGSGPQAWNGLIDDVRIYNRALTPGEIERIMRGNPLLAWDPKPVYGSTVDYLNVFPITWSPGENAVQHDVYLGLDRLAVADADTSTADIYQGRQDANSFDGSPETLVLNQDYYWRIDEINSDETITKGSVWRFTVPDYLLVEDFEAYNDLNEDEAGSNRIYLAWSDGYANPSVNGSTIGYPEPDFVVGEYFVETDIVHGGSQSGPLLYNNTTASYSEVTISTDLLTIGPDWTVGETETLALWIYGDPNNSATEQMYVKIDDEKISINPDMTLAQWQEVTIDLDTVNTDLSNVTTFGIGIERTGAAGGEGMVFIDDIRLYLLLEQ